MARSELLHKTSDVALLSIAEGCGKTLVELDLNGCEMVTDVGVSWVAHQAGATLEVFNLRGCNRLTNAGRDRGPLPRDPRRGPQRRRVTDVGVRVLGAALGDTLETLDISSMHLVTDGVDRGFGFEGCWRSRRAWRLKCLHLDGCFQVSNRALSALAKGCSTLVELGLAGCPRLTANGVGALCHASRETLEKVNLGCCGDCVDDDLVSALARGSPNLKQLFLRDCERWGQFGDIGLAWLVEGPGSKSLVTLSMYRCSCTSAALKSSRDHFPHSEMKRDNGFFGFWPKPRWEHRIQIHEFAKHRRGVVKLQSAYRALLGRRAAQHLRNLRALARAVLVLQKHRRGYLGRRRFARLKAEFVRRWNASTTIEAFGRGCAGRARVKRIRTLIAFRLATAAATRIQAATTLLRKERRLKGCGTIQRIYRGFLGRKRFQHFVDLDNAMIALRNRSRCERAKKEVAAVRAALKLRKQREHAMAVMLQARVRIIHTKNLVRKRKRARDAKKKVALCLQACYRAKRDSIIVYIAAAERQNKIEQAAAAVIQRAHRSKVAAREMRRRKALKRAKEKREWDASIVIQSGGRGYACRVRVAELRRQQEEFDRKMAEMEVWAAAVEAGYFEAAIECGTCKEFYCNDCFGQVHYGGKRAGHLPRALRRLARRVDYGDGDFELESMWPSEIVQDDVAGILLRISPHREPVETVGTWQRYADPDTGTSYYYNPVSGEGTYEEPRAVAEHLSLTNYQYAKQMSDQYAVLGAAPDPYAQSNPRGPYYAQTNQAIEPQQDTNLYSHLEYGAT
ncbi:hypothetical protein JL722_15150 [Aureococcus anophagefferens]|nr:hypothetical protein JL722_15150 [Aureococcus anophagefferens]